MTERPDVPARVHLVGIGGAGMSGLARILLQRGHTVSGSDLKDGVALDELRALGAQIQIGHRPDAVGSAHTVVVSSAVRGDNPEIQRARERGIPVQQRAQLLAALMSDDRRILIGGTHGKTTTTSMVVVAMQASGGDPSFSIGGQLNEAGTNAHAGTQPTFVAEADESDRSLLTYAPDVAVITNAELDHPDAFANEAQVREVFTQFLARRRRDGVAVLCHDDPGSAALAVTASGPVITYGEHPGADVRLIVEDANTGRLRFERADVARLQLKVPGVHNLLNATAAVAVGLQEGIDPAVAASGLGAFTGAARRFQILGEVHGVTVVDDYAHHPTELRAALAAARSRKPARVIVVVQPHRYSRTRMLGGELGRAAAAADVVVVTEIYAAAESSPPGISGRIVAEAAEAAGARVVWTPHLADVATVAAELARRGDLILLAGAGDISQVGPQLLSLLGAHRG